MAPNLSYTGFPLDRAHEARRDPDRLAAMLADPERRVLAFWRNRSALMPGPAPRPLFLEGEEAARAEEMAAERVLLGLDDAGRPVLAVDLSPVDEDRLVVPVERFRDLREVGPVMAGPEASVLAVARGLLYWHRQQRFCGRCGAPTASRHGGSARRCTDTDCKREHFPRLDPAVIMLVTHGDHCLLARQPHWPAGMVSTLAGFVEVGESLEQTVVREVHEEAGITVAPDGVHYRASQPWPFPNSLMLAFQAEATSTEIRHDPHELELCRWFDRDDLRDLNALGFGMPRSDSVARWLIESWLERG